LKATTSASSDVPDDVQQTMPMIKIDLVPLTLMGTWDAVRIKRVVANLLTNVVTSRRSLRTMRDSCAWWPALAVPQARACFVVPRSCALFANGSR
jgi:hypothetical protein